MARFEKITGGAITRIFDELIQRKTPVKMTLIDADCEYLTRITALANRKKTSNFVINTPEGFEQTAADIAVCRIAFEFAAKDHIKYAFTVLGAEIAGNRIYLKLPQELKRLQRRELFRLKAPAGTRLCLSQDADQLELDVMNISIGGSLAATGQTTDDITQQAPFAMDQMLTDVALVFPPEIRQRSIKIEAVRIKRIRQNPVTMHYEVGVEFCQISSGEQKRLTDLIYGLQRQYLRHRLPLDI